MSNAEKDAAEIRAKIEASSLGTPEVQALRATVSDEHAARIVKRAEELGAGCTCSPYFGCCDYSPDCPTHGTRPLPPDRTQVESHD